MTEKFVHRQNIQHFRRLLAETKDDHTRKIIRGLLDEECAKDEPPPDEGFGGDSSQSRR